MMRKLLAKWKTYHNCHKKTAVLWLGFGGTIALLAIFLLLVHLPLERAAQEYRSEATEAAAEIVTVGNFQNAHLDRKAYLAELNKRQERARRAVPDSLEQGKFIVYVERLAQQSRIQLQQVSPQSKREAGEKDGLSLHLRLQGGYFSLLRFMRGMQEGERLVVVNNLAVHAEGQQLVTDLAVNIFAVSDK